MGKEIGKILADMRTNPKNVRFSDLCRVCDKYFGESRQSGGSHRVYSVPIKGRPPINIQDNGGKAKAYQVRQVLTAIGELGVKE